MDKTTISASLIAEAISVAFAKFPSFVASSVAFAEFLFAIITGWLFFTRFVAITRPILPSPITATFDFVIFYVDILLFFWM